MALRASTSPGEKPPGWSVAAEIAVPDWHEMRDVLDGYEIRTAAVTSRVPCITTVQGLAAAVQGIEALRSDVKADLPPLLKGYLRAGATICGAPAWDPDFDTADLPILMPMSKISDRYSKHFIEKQRG